MHTQNLLIELGSEELPPKALPTLAQAFQDNLATALNENDFSYTDICWYASPRRLAIYATDVSEQQPDKVVEKRGPAISAAFDEQGNPTKAALGWARGNGISVDQAERLVTDKGEWLLHKAELEGQNIHELLAGLVEKALKSLPIPKPMRWGANKVQFIRPVHSLCMLFGNELVAGNVLGLTSTRTILGHRFHAPEGTELDHADNYLSALEACYVMADFDSRRQTITQQISVLEAELNGQADVDPELLNEVTALVEWPVALSAAFDPTFLQVPKEALIYTMKDDQRYFPVLDNQGQLLPKFIFISNIESRDPAQVISGNEKVIAPRLADAEFFFNSDRKHSLESRIDSLDTVLFQKQLGTLKDKSIRIAANSQHIAGLLGADSEQAKRAGLLCKTDLMTQVVMEFPDVQGVMGMHYARLDGESEAVALAMDQQYKPRFAGDSLPATGISQALALADKLDTLVGIFGIGQLPKGDKDPFALRRAAIGVLRIAIDTGKPLDLHDLINTAIAQYQPTQLSNPHVAEQVLDFVLSRFKAYYQEQGISAEVIQAVMANKPTQPADFNARIKGVDTFTRHSASKALAAANKRVANILAKNPLPADITLNTTLLQTEQEQALANALQQVAEQIQPHLAKGDYAQVLSALAELQEPVDAFFDNVMVMADDNALRNNRLALLSELRKQFLYVADISVLG